jgi:choline-glycine betaine transporter
MVKAQIRRGNLMKYLAVSLVFFCLAGGPTHTTLAYVATSNGDFVQYNTATGNRHADPVLDSLTDCDLSFHRS